MFFANFRTTTLFIVRRFNERVKDGKRRGKGGMRGGEEEEEGEERNSIEVKGQTGRKS